MILDVYAVTDAGRFCVNNEDNYFLSGYTIREPEQSHASVRRFFPAHGTLLAVCDGMGGEDCGELASHAAVQAMRVYSELSQRESAVRNTSEANSAVLCIQVQQNAPWSGCTLAALEFRNNLCTCFNVGDSRAYRLHENEFFQMSYDHTAVHRLVELGILSQDEADCHPQRHSLTQSLGETRTDGQYVPYISESVSLKPGDKFLICTDGLYEEMNQKRTLDILSQEKSVEEIGNQLLREAMDCGSRDNITVIVILAEESDPL